MSILYLQKWMRLIVLYFVYIILLKHKKFMLESNWWMAVRHLDWNDHLTVLSHQDLPVYFPKHWLGLSLKHNAANRNWMMNFRNFSLTWSPHYRLTSQWTPRGWRQPGRGNGPSAQSRSPRCKAPSRCHPPEWEFGHKFFKWWQLLTWIRVFC